MTRKKKYKTKDKVKHILIRKVYKSDTIGTLCKINPEIKPKEEGGRIYRSLKQNNKIIMKTFSKNIFNLYSIKIFLTFEMHYSN